MNNSTNIAILAQGVELRLLRGLRKILSGGMWFAVVAAVGALWMQEEGEGPAGSPASLAEAPTRPGLVPREHTP